ncbi:MAG: NifB/NifX family molybdenum-iron cluster-binding protein [Candidatus Bathyarchaeia archaeon]
MKVAVSATGPGLDAQVDPRFGRCQHFVIVDVDAMTFEAIPNTNAGAMSGAGIQAAQAVANKGVGAVITGNVGPNAYRVLSTAGVRIFTGAFGTVREAVEKFKAGQLRETTTPGPAGFGMRPGMGTGAGTGMGGGMRRSRGMGTGRGMWALQPTPFPQAPVSAPATPPPMSREQEASLLESQMRSLQQQLDQIKRRLEELKGSPLRREVAR